MCNKGKNSSEKTIIKSNQECKLTLETPYKKLTTDRYVLYTVDGKEKCIEVNGFTIDDLIDFNNRLSYLILKAKNNMNN